MVRRTPKSKKEAIRDHHNPRSTWYRTTPLKKGGAGNRNWGTVTDYCDPTDFPLNEPFNDPSWSDVGEADNRKIRVASISSDSSASSEL